MSVWNELKRRNVFKVGAAYLIVAWLVLQVVATVKEPLNLPDSLDTVVIVLLAVGFPVALLLAWAYELTPAGLKATAEVDKDESITHLTGQRLNYVVTGLLAVAVVFLAIDRFVVGRTAPAAPPEAASAAEDAGSAGVQSPSIANAPSVASGPSVAVLPFDNLSSDPDQDYFADGISLELRDQLYNAQNLYVTPRELVLPLKDSTDPPAAIAQALGVANLLTGSIRKAGQTVRIDATLTRAADGSRIWQQSFDGSLEQVLDFQGAIAAAVIEALTGSFDPDATEVFPGGTDNELAYDLYLRGKANDQPDEPLQLFNQALALDPDFALAQIALADRLLFRAEAAGSGASEELTGAAESAVERAVELAPGLVGTQLLVARRNVSVGQWLAAEQVFRALVEQTGGRDFDAESRYGAFLMLVGRLTDSIPHLQRARELSPLSAIPDIFLAMVYDSLGQTTRSEELARSAEPLFVSTPFVKYGPAFWRAMYRQDYVEARRVGELALGGPQFGGNDFTDRDAMLAWARETFEEPQAQFATAQQFVALFAANFGDTELAVSAWRKTLQSSSAYMSFHWTPLMTPVRTDPDFKDALREAGLVDYWRQAGWPDQCRPVGDDDFECR